MNKHDSEILRPSYITIYESELQVTAGVSALWGSNETGGMCFGLRTHGGRVASWKEIGGRGGDAPGLLVKIVVRVPEKVAVWLEVRRQVPG